MCSKGNTLMISPKGYLGAAGIGRWIGHQGLVLRGTSHEPMEVLKCHRSGVKQTSTLYICFTSSQPNMTPPPSPSLPPTPYPAPCSRVHSWNMRSTWRGVTCENLSACLMIWAARIKVGTHLATAIQHTPSHHCKLSHNHTHHTIT